jgi:modulator of FtsH protease HflK
VASPSDPNLIPPDPDDLPSSPSFGMEGPEIEDDAPRRAASARFVVDGSIGSEAAMRDAMDPANQSLAEALRLSFRVLQIVILVLIVLFLGSGFQTVRDGQSGVATLWGDIVSVNGEQALTPGLKFSFYPYPAGEFILLDVENRSVDLKETFKPMSRGRDPKEMLETAAVTNPLTPNRDGSLLTRSGELAHMELAARYSIEQPVEFVEVVNDADPARNADKLVHLALQRAAIHVAAELTTEQLVDENLREDTGQRIRLAAQDVLDQLQSGIRIESLTAMKGSLPLAIEKTSDDLQATKGTSDLEMTQATQQASETLTRMAGANHKKLSDLIDSYHSAYDAGNLEDASRLQQEINQQLESSETTGTVSEIIQSAQGFRSQIDLTLGAELARFRSLLPAYRQNPELVVRRQWLEAYARILRQPDTEVIYLDPGMDVRLSLSGSAMVQQIRRTNMLNRKEAEANRIGIDPFNPLNFQHGQDMSIGKPGRQFEKDQETGGVKPTGTPR